MPSLSRLTVLAVTALASLLAACSGDDGGVIPSQQWNGLNVQVQSRPAPVVPGMDEFILIVNRGMTDHPAPTENVIVSIRVDDTDDWKQMIQDGYMGVYRRAVKVTDPRHEVLNVQIQQGDNVGYLRFPLLAPPPKRA